VFTFHLHVLNRISQFRIFLWPSRGLGFSSHPLSTTDAVNMSSVRRARPARASRSPGRGGPRRAVHGIPVGGLYRSGWRSVVADVREFQAP
jgi:hypothetical protein